MFFYDVEVEFGPSEGLTPELLQLLALDLAVEVQDGSAGVDLSQVGLVHQLRDLASEIEGLGFVFLQKLGLLLLCFLHVGGLLPATGLEPFFVVLQVGEEILG